MMRKLAALLCLALLLLPHPAGAEAAETAYTIVDEKGDYVTHYLGQPEAGDEYIARDNGQYVIIRVDDAHHMAVAEARGTYQMPDVSWLHDDSQPVSARSQRAVAIYCTHSDESYVPTDGDASLTPRGGIYDVAEALKGNLEKQGVTVYYDTATHLPHDNAAYQRSRATAERLLQKDVDAIFDVHRDGIEDPDQYNTTIDGEAASMVRLLVGRSNQNADTNKAFAAELKAVADELYPDLVRDIYIGKGTYNQDLFPRSVLLEFGTHTVSKERAEAATAYMAETIQKTLYGGVSGAAGSSEERATAAQKKGAWTGVIWIIGIAAVGAAVYALLSTGGMRPALRQLKDGAREMGGGLFGKKNKE